MMLWLCRVDMVLVGAEGVVENGGVINKLGTYHIAIAAKAHNIPFYVASESYKVSHVACLPACGFRQIYGWRIATILIAANLAGI